MSENWSHIRLENIPEGHIIAGFCAHIKVLDENGEMYWAVRMRDLNDMEAYGMAQDMANAFQRDLAAGKVEPRDD